VTSSSSTESWSVFTDRDGRRFAFPVGTAFFVLAAVLWWREHETPMWVMAALGTALYAAGLVAPGRLGPVYSGWMKLALAISKVTTPIFMGVVYFLVFTPAGLIMRAVGKRPIVHRLENGSYWRSAHKEYRDLRRQF
jgi:hypothetical protein